MKSPTINLESLVNAQDTPAVIIDCDYKIIAANTAYCASYGIDPLQIVTRCCHEVSHRSAVPCHLNGEHCPHHEVFANNKPFQVLHTHYDPLGHPDLVRIKAYPLQDASGKQYLLETIHRLAPPVDLSCEEMRMVGKSPAFLQCMENLFMAAKSNAPVLINGESGVGKELAAQFVHQQSGRKSAHYLELNCAAIPEALCESELFGHERGAFTGSTNMKKGLFELADGGSLFLDEIGEMPLAMQSKMLRVLDSGEFRRVGGHKLIKTNVRIIAATNQNLLTLIKEGRFREDLYFRVSAIKVIIPPLRERHQDIAALADRLIKRMCADNGQECLLSTEAIQKLETYHFPGNIRELSNILHKAVALCDNGIICADHIHLDQPIAHHHQCGAAFIKAGVIDGISEHTHPDPLSMSDLELLHITDLLRQHSGNRRVVAGILGISQRTLYRKIKRYNLDERSGTLANNHLGGQQHATTH